MKGDFSEEHPTGVGYALLRQPLGVVIISPDFRPWCHCGSTVAIIAAGNTVVLKPSEKTPSGCPGGRTFYRNCRTACSARSTRRQGSGGLTLLGRIQVQAAYFVGSRSDHQVHLRDRVSRQKRVRRGGAKKEPHVGGATYRTPTSISRGHWLPDLLERCMAISVFVYRESNRSPT
jgi:hypothetical protein